MSRWVVKATRAHKSCRKLAHDVCDVIAEALERGIEDARRKDTATISIVYQSMSGAAGFRVVAYPKDSTSLFTKS